jgi:hypothetical protein
MSFVERLKDVDDMASTRDLASSARRHRNELRPRHMSSVRSMSEDALDEPEEGEQGETVDVARVIPASAMKRMRELLARWDALPRLSRVLRLPVCFS